MSKQDNEIVEPQICDI